MFLPEEFYARFEKIRRKEKYPVSTELLRASYYEDLRLIEKKYSKEELVRGRIILFLMVDLMLDELDNRYNKAKNESDIEELNHLAKHLRVKRHHRSGFIKKYSNMFESVKQLLKELDSSK
jgi:coproporphyrinogen III oxidase-like Fe-S oxidoreductase